MTSIRKKLGLLLTIVFALSLGTGLNAMGNNRNRRKTTSQFTVGGWMSKFLGWDAQESSEEVTDTKNDPYWWLWRAGRIASSAAVGFAGSSWLAEYDSKHGFSYTRALIFAPLIAGGAFAVSSSKEAPLASLVAFVNYLRLAK